MNQVLPCRSFCLLGTCVRRFRCSCPDCCTVPRNPYCRTHGTADRWPSLLLATSYAARHRRSWLEKAFAIIIGKKISCNVNRWQIFCAVAPFGATDLTRYMIQDLLWNLAVCTWCVRKVMTLNAWLDNWQCCSHTSVTSRDIYSYLMISASFNSIALTRVIWQRVV